MIISFLTTVHIYYGTDTSETGRRVQEIDAVASLLNKRAKNDNENYILLGDFNISQTTDVTMQQLDKNDYYLTKWRTFQMSDHLPLWIELKVDFSNQYLQKIPKS